MRTCGYVRTSSCSFPSNYVSKPRRLCNSYSRRNSGCFPLEAPGTTLPPFFPVTPGTKLPPFSGMFRFGSIRFLPNPVPSGSKTGSIRFVDRTKSDLVRSDSYSNPIRFNPVQIHTLSGPIRFNPIRFTLFVKISKTHISKT